MNNAILLSGGVDSISLAFWKKPKVAYTIDYGQKPALAEIKAATAVCLALNITHEIIYVNCSELGSGDLSTKIALPIAPSSEWWPYRNQLLVTLAAMRAINQGISELLVGSVLSDGFHNDGTQEFYTLISSLLSYQEGNLIVSAPCLEMSSVDLVIKSAISPEILYFAHSCHKSNIPCGNCRGCNKYREVFQQLRNANWGS